MMECFGSKWSRIHTRLHAARNDVRGVALEHLNLPDGIFARPQFLVEGVTITTH